MQPQTTLIPPCKPILKTPWAGQGMSLAIQYQRAAECHNTMLLEKSSDARFPDMAPGHKDYEHRIETTEAERIAVAAAKLASTDTLNELFTAFGINRADAEAMESLRRDFRFVRSLRRRKDIWDDLGFLQNVRAGSIKAGSRFFLALITILAASFAYGMAQVGKEWIALLVGSHIKGP